MKKKLTLCLLLTILFKCSYAQYDIKENSVWIFGTNAGIDFRSGTAVPIQSSFGGDFGVDEGCASVADANGNLLFYAGGDTVYNKDGQAMPNGYRIMALTNQTLFPGAIQGSSSSATQAMLILPVFDNPNRYYVFAVEGIESWTSLQGGKISYSIVDMTLDNGKGDVVPGTNATVLDSGMTEKMVAVAGNNCNIWLLAHTVGDEIRAFEITSAGISTTPVVSTVGHLVGNGLYPYQAGVMKISPDRKKLVVTSLNNWQGPVGVEVCDFDPATGIVSNAMVLDSSSDSQQGYYGAAFSPDNTKLYVAGNDTTTNHTYTLRQYDISLPTRQDIINSKYDLDGGSNFYYGKDLQLGPDGKIYVVIVNSDVLGVITDPNASGAACNFNANGITLLTDTRVGSGLPNQYVKISFPDVGITVNNFELGTNNTYDSYQWYLDGQMIQGATNNTYTVTQNGTYSVRVTNTMGCSDTASHIVTNVDVASLEEVRAGIRVYPNPARDAVHITSPIAVGITIHSADGKEIIRAKTNGGKIDISKLENGIYIINFVDEHGVILKNEKLIKLN